MFNLLRRAYLKHEAYEIFEKRDLSLYLIGSHFDEAIIGITHNDCVVYNAIDVIKIISKEMGISIHEAVEWYSANILPATECIKNGPIFVEMFAKDLI